MNAPPEPTLTDLQRRFGAMPISRICPIPMPGTAIEDDVTMMRDTQRRIFELVDGILVEKALGSKESKIAAVLIRIIGNFIQPNKLGKVLGEAGMFRLKQGLVRIPDVSYVSPIQQTVRVYYSPDQSVTIDSIANFEHSRLFPDLQFAVEEIFAE